jgi:hypothetical protein
MKLYSYLVGPDAKPFWMEYAIMIDRLRAAW